MWCNEKCVWCDESKCYDVWCGLIDQEWCISCESDKSSDQYLPTLEDVMEGRTEELNSETLSLLMVEQRASYNSWFLENTTNFQIYRQSRNHSYRYMYNCKHIYVYIYIYIYIHYFRKCLTVWCLSKFFLLFQFQSAIRIYIL
jgi:hypothetical protein